VLALTLAAGGAALAGAAGRIEGTIAPAGAALKVGAVERIPATIMKLQDKRHWGTIDPKTGQYAIDNLEPKEYDLVIETREGRIEGVTFSVRGETREPTYDMNVETGEIQVQRFDINQYIESEQALTDEQRNALIRKKLRIDKLLERLQKLLKVSRFMDTNRPLHIHGTRQRAVVLMELVRADQFYAGKQGEAIWRVESWPFIWMYDVWHKPNKGLKVWQRLRLQGDDFAKLGYVFDPALGGIEVEAGKAAKFDYTLPATLPKSMGKIPSEPK
jgi:hypothetical protein